MSYQEQQRPDHRKITRRRASSVLAEISSLYDFSNRRPKEQREPKRSQVHNEDDRLLKTIEKTFLQGLQNLRDNSFYNNPDTEHDLQTDRDHLGIDDRHITFTWRDKNGMNRRVQATIAVDVDEKGNSQRYLEVDGYAWKDEQDATGNLTRHQKTESFGAIELSKGVFLDPGLSEMLFTAHVVTTSWKREDLQTVRIANLSPPCVEL